MRRREFIALLSSGVAGWPLAARAQQGGKLPTIGYFAGTKPAADNQRVAACLRDERCDQGNYQ
jgi:hypothetical protein